MTNLNAQVPDLLYQQMASFAARQKVSLDQLITTALSAQLELWTKDELEVRAKRGSWQKVQQVLAKVPDVEPEEYDRL